MLSVRKSDDAQSSAQLDATPSFESRLDAQAVAAQSAPWANHNRNRSAAWSSFAFEITAVASLLHKPEPSDPYTFTFFPLKEAHISFDGLNEPRRASRPTSDLWPDRP